MKTFKGKSIYNPSGKAGEYSYWACNFYNGCSNGCTYCYLRKGVLKNTCGGDKPTLKKCFIDEEHAFEIFEKELFQNLPELQKHGLFFSFTTDPMLPETRDLTELALGACRYYEVPVKLLTKCTDWVEEYIIDFHRFCLCGKVDEIKLITDYVAFGFTLSGHDELEPNASTNAERIEAMHKLHDAGFKTWASIEPIINFRSSFEMIKSTLEFCKLFKIGLKSGQNYEKEEILRFIDHVVRLINNSCYYNRIYFKDSLLKQAGINREELPINCVDRDYNIFKN